MKNGKAYLTGAMLGCVMGALAPAPFAFCLAGFLLLVLVAT